MGFQPTEAYGLVVGWVSNPPNATIVAVFYVYKKLSGSLKPFTHKPYGLFGGLETHPTTTYRSIIKNNPFCRKAKHKTAHCSLLTAHCSLLTTHCSLLTVIN
ncbi:MAG: hypothetical protein J5680_06410, partial [Neisseriaceae bacterium]|nr:hypothetical protein [Neisseriaceae bacterium]